HPPPSRLTPALLPVPEPGTTTAIPRVQAGRVLRAYAPPSAYQNTEKVPAPAIRQAAPWSPSSLRVFPHKLGSLAGAHSLPAQLHPPKLRPASSPGSLRTS